MASDRVLIVRILGIGRTAGTNNAAAFTSRAGLSYLGANEVPGVVVDVGSQLSSDIAIFGALGSDPTTTFTLLSTALISQLMLSRGKVPVLAADGANVTVTEYVKPFGVSNLGNVYVTDTTNLASGDMIRIANTVFEVSTVVSSTVLQVQRRWGCADVPIAMGITGFGIFGSTVYNVSPGNPTGGIESLPVVISTAPLSATLQLQEEIIFRGIVNKASTDTSAKAQNRIKVDCGSLMSFVKSAKFTPAQGGTRVVLKRPDDAVSVLTDGAMNVDFYVQTTHDQRLYGTPWEVTAAVGDVRVPLLQVRSKEFGGMIALDTVAPWTNETIDGFSVYVAQASTQFRLDPTNPTLMSANGYLQSFRDGWFTGRGYGPTLEPAITAVQEYATTIFGQNPIGYTWQTQDAWFNPEKLGETTFIGSDFASLIIDLLLGTFEGDLDFVNGCRAATEAAWLPFGVQSGVTGVQDLIDIPSLYTAVLGVTAAQGTSELPNTPTGISDAAGIGSTGNVLPYMHDDVKTVGDVLEELLKRSGLYMVYDKCKFRFGRWSQRPPTPTVINDTGLAEPKVSLTFDRNNCVQTALLKICWRAEGDSPVTQSVPINNIDLGIGALGKVVNLSHWQPLGSIENLPTSDMFTNAVQLVTRYSQAAALIEVVYRDDVFDLVVGQQVAFSSDYVPNPNGGMGVTLASGFVMKAARSWQTPTTAYTIALPGYLSTINRVAVYSCSGTVVSVSGNDVTISANDYTQPPATASDGAPTSDAEAFALSLQLQGGPIEVILRDQFGTSSGISDTLSAVSGNTLLNLPSIAAAASPGDVIVLAPAPMQSSVDTLWDVFQADTTGVVDGSAALAYKWVL